MSTSSFTLCGLLHNHYSHVDTGRISHVEQVAIFLYICAQGNGYKQATERFQHSLSTISKTFHRVLNALIDFSAHQLQAPVHADVHPRIRDNSMYYPHFEDCIEALDGNVRVTIRNDIKVPFIGKSGTTTQNVLGVCNFDMCFTYVYDGWEGSMHDARIMGIVLGEKESNFFRALEDKFYLVDFGYPNMKGFLAPYKNERYHLNTFHGGHVPRNANEMFNKAHASFRSVIERSFSVWKNRWHILDEIQYTDVDVQSLIIAATMALHNFIHWIDRDGGTDPSIS